MNKRILQEIVVGGLTSLAVVGAYIVLRSYWDGAHAGDWLQFAGAMFGSAAAVAGAVFIESWRRRRDKEQGQATLLDVLNQMNGSFSSAAAPLKDDLSKDISEINARRFVLEVTKGFAEFVLKQHLRPDSRVWQHTHGFIHYIDRILSVTWYVYDEHANDDLCSKESVEHWYKAVTKIVENVRPIITREIAEAKRISTDAVSQSDR